MGRKILAVVTLFALVPICYAQEKDPYGKIKLSVIEFLKKGEGSPAGCDLFKDFLAKDPLNVGKRKMMVGFCDSDINFSKPVSFSEMHTYQFEGHSYVCGVISGKTKLDQKIGVRFISAEPYHLVLNVKYSRRPIAYASDDSFLIDNYRLQLKSFNELNSKYCK